MKKLMSLLFILFLFNSSGAEESFFEQEATSMMEGEQFIDDSGEVSPIVEFLLDWKTISILGVLIMTSLITLTYTLAISFDIPELRAWADVELSEAISSVLIITLMMGVIIFAGASVESLICSDVSFAHKAYCHAGSQDYEFVVSAVSVDYVDMLISTSEDLYFDLLEQNLEVAAVAQESRTVGVVYTMFLNFAFSGKINPHLSIKSEKFQQELQFLDNILFSLNSQRFLLKSLSFVVAPLLIMLGAILRPFFLTRKLGGLLIAAGISFLLVLPATYVLSSYTIKTTVYGAKALSGGPSFANVCPKACKMIPSSGFDSEKSYSRSKVINLLYDNGKTEEEVVSFVNGEIEKITVEGSNLYSCEYYDNPEFGNACNINCRELPFPVGIDFCMYQRETCADMPDECKVVRYVKGDIPIYELGNYVSETDLNTLLPDADDILGEGFKEIVTFEKTDGTPAGGLCRKECRSIPPLKADCDNRCPPQCLYQFSDGGVDETCFNSCDDKGREFDGTCIGDYVCRDLYFDVPNGKDLIKDNLVKPEDNCVEIIPVLVRDKGHLSVLEGGCYECIYLFDSGFHFEPQLHTDCAVLCGGDYGSSTPVYTEDLETTMNKIDGFVGSSDIKSVSKLMIPAYLFPIFNLVITFMFIQTLSPLLGGDMNIPGLLRAI